MSSRRLPLRRWPMSTYRLLICSLLCLLPWLPSMAQQPSAAPGLPTQSWESPALAAFQGTYEAFYKGKLAGDATLQLKPLPAGQWEVSLEVRGKRGFAGVLGLNLLQTTVFDLHDGQYRPLSQHTVRRGLLLGKKLDGIYDWAAGTAQWKGDIERKRRAPVALQPGDLSALLINLAIMRDARPGARMQYRFADVGRLRMHQYQAADSTETVPVGDLSYDALRVWRSNASAGDAMVLWLANGVPTPVRIAQQEDGEDTIDLRLIHYQGE